MFPQLDPYQAAYQARLIVSILGVLLFLSLAIWMIHRRQKLKSSETDTSVVEIPDTIDLPSTLNIGLNSLSSEEQSNRTSALEQAYQEWKSKRLLQAEETHALFLRTGVEKNGLRYQLVASSQVQAMAILITAVMAQSDPQASVQAEALFASLLAHPAYGQSQLTSWQYLPDLPRSPKLDPDPHAEAWVIYALLKATKRWPEMNRFHYSELISERLDALEHYVKTLEPEQIEQLPFNGYLIKQLLELKPNLDGTLLGGSEADFFARLDEQEDISNNPDSSKFAMSLFQLGLLAYLDHDPNAQDAISKAQPALTRLIEENLNDQPTNAEFNRIALLACAAPVVLTLKNQDLNNRVWDELASSQPDKNDGLGATLQLFGMALLANQQIVS